MHLCTHIGVVWWLVKQATLVGLAGCRHVTAMEWTTVTVAVPVAWPWSFEGSVVHAKKDGKLQKLIKSSFVAVIMAAV